MFEGCGSVFQKIGKLNRHMISHSTERPYSCDKCDKSFRRKEHLAVHAQIHAPSDSDRKPWLCAYPDCTNRFATKYHLNRHISIIHCAERPFKCPQQECDAAFSKHTQLRTHMSVHTGKLAYPCAECDKSFPTPSKLKLHSLTHASEADSKYICGFEECGLAFPKWSALQAHNRKAHTPVCPTCNKSFQTATLLRNHIKIHDLDHELFSCSWHEGCDKVFYSRKSRDLHIQVAHKNIRRFACNVSNCDKAFAHKRTLNNHLKKHETELDTLSKKRKRSLDDLELLTGMSYIQDRSIPCQFEGCIFRFKRQYDLSRHMFALHGVVLTSDQEPLNTSELFQPESYNLQNRAGPPVPQVPLDVEFNFDSFLVDTFLASKQTYLEHLFPVPIQAEPSTTLNALV
ncbi:hypothetical protein RTP6_005463 [Batrachochytrium dendrobatidis]